MWLAASVRRRLPVILLSVAVVALAGILVLTRRGAVMVEQRLGPTSCAYDDRLQSVVMSVPLSVETRGEVSLQVQAQVRDRRDRARMPYVSTRIVTFDTGSHAERHDVKLRISMPRSEWLAGHNDCGISVRTVHLP